MRSGLAPEAEGLLAGRGVSCSGSDLHQARFVAHLLFLDGNSVAVFSICKRRGENQAVRKEEGEGEREVLAGHQSFLFLKACAKVFRRPTPSSAPSPFPAPWRCQQLMARTEGWMPTLWHQAPAGAERAEPLLPAPPLPIHPERAQQQQL